MVDFGLLVLCVGGTAALLAAAESYRRRVAQQDREGAESLEVMRRQTACREREADLREQEIANQRRRLDLDEREIRIEEREIGDDQDDDDGFRTGRGPHF